ncbi:MAG: hypothetical protein FJX44_05750 [Alphaproteobacteria bacterium]|nr:hypothetical protein [Alphaproteobacteria bacterium]
MQSQAGRQAGAQLRRVGWLLHAYRLETKLHALDHAVKANFNPNQPRVPAGNADGGQWTGGGGGGGGASARESGETLSGGDGDDRPGSQPKVPKHRPGSARARTTIVKQVARYVASFAIRSVVKRGRIILEVLQQGSWLEEYAPYIRAYVEPPKSLEELQDAVSSPQRGYDIHHIVEQTSAEQDGFPRSLIDSPENLVRIPTLRHWQVTAWSMLRNENYGGVSPRTYLRGRSWEERMKVGKDALIKNGVLKP